MRRIGVAVLAVAALCVTAAVPAGGVHWPNFGGDVGRSGFQPVDEGGVPARVEWVKTGVGDQDVRTSIITSAGSLTTQRVIYGTDDGRIHIRKLLGGGLVNPALASIDLSAAANGFGTGSASVSPVETSTAAGLGQIFAVVNDRFAPVDPDPVGRPYLRIAQLDETSGELVRNDAVAGGEDDVIESSPVITPPDAAGNRSIFFVAGEQGGTYQGLWKIDITNPTSRTAGIGAPVRTADLNANTLASPSIVWLNAPDGTPTMYVAVGTQSGLMTFRASDLAAGPAAPGLGQSVRTPSTPVTASGNAPGAPNSGLAVTPAIYVASTAPAGGTLVHKLTQSANSQVLTVASSGVIAGEGADALMTDQRALSGGAPTEASVFVGTTSGLFAVRTSDLTVSSSIAGSFRKTVPVGTGTIVAVARDNGEQLILETSTGVLTPVEADLFTQDPANATASKSFGQPSISRRFLQFASDKGVFVYGLRRATPPTGYWLVASDGGIFAYGDAGFFGSTGAMTLNKPIVGMAATPSRDGYWLVASDGGIFAYGDAGFFGSTGAMTLNKPIVGMAPTPSGLGYWLVASDGGVFAYGPDAAFFGSTGDLTLNKPIVGIAPTLDGRGYWLVASDGGIFAFGSAVFHGSTGAMTLNKPIVGMGAEPNGRGYWLVASDGGVFAYGRSRFFGSTGAIPLNSPIVGMGPSATALGYLFTAADGGVFAFGDVPFHGSAASLGKLNRPVVGMAVKP